MKRLLASAFALGLLGSVAAPAFAQQYYHHDQRAYGHRDYRYVQWQRAPHRYRYWHNRRVYYYNNAWGYWGYQNGVHVFISVPL
jgi:hypothetical protein